MFHIKRKCSIFSVLYIGHRLIIRLFTFSVSVSELLFSYFICWFLKGAIVVLQISPFNFLFFMNIKALKFVSEGLKLVCSWWIINLIHKKDF